MKKSLLCICAVLMLIAESLSASNLKVMSFNVRYDNPGDGINGWAMRRNRVADAIRFYAADIVGTQEVLVNQLADLRERLPEYNMVGVGREDGNTQGEYAALWYRSDRFELVDYGNFWLSATPEVAGSMGWDGACVRIATWAKLRETISGRMIFALNTHLDHVGIVARREGVRLILDRANELSDGLPIVVTGDFNSTPESSVIMHITGESTPHHLINTRTASPVVYGPAWSYQEFGRLNYNERALIDYVFISNDLTTETYGVLAETNNGRYLSDHCPVLVSLRW